VSHDTDQIQLILNPSAHSEKAQKSVAELRGLSDRLIVHESRSFEQAHDLAKAAADAGTRAIAVAGGDGTVNAVISGLAGSATTLGVFPTGTMNLFAREIGLPKSDLRACWQVIEKGATSEVDLFKANDQVFVQVAGVGFDAQIIEATSWEKKKRFGPLSYLLSGLSVARQKPPRITVRTAEGLEVTGAFVLIGNGALYGPAFKIFRDASNQDGLLDVIVFGGQNYLDILRYVSGATIGNLEKMRGVTYLQTASISIDSDTPAPVEVDGELAGTTPVHFRLMESKLRVFTP
jgi:diacylglycerol kinase (ATP)